MKHNKTRQPQLAEDWTPASAVAILTLALAFAYAILRYVVFKGVSSSHVPLLILDKSVAFTGLFMVALSLSSGPLARIYPRRMRGLLKARRTAGLIGFFFACFHMALALVLLKPSYFPKFFQLDGTFSLGGEMSMLAGLSAAAILTVMACTSYDVFKSCWPHQNWKALHRFGGSASLLLVATHLVSMGWKSWADYEQWPKGLPPITLVAITAVVIAMLSRCFAASRRA